MLDRPATFRESTQGVSGETQRTPSFLPESSTGEGTIGGNLARLERIFSLRQRQPSPLPRNPFASSSGAVLSSEEISEPTTSRSLEPTLSPRPDDLGGD